MRRVLRCLTAVLGLSFGLGSVAELLSAQSAQPWDAVLARARAAAQGVPGELPQSLHYLTFATSTSPLAELVQGASTNTVEAVLPVFQIRYARGWIMVDAGMDRDVDSWGCPDSC